MWLFALLCCLLQLCYLSELTERSCQSEGCEESDRSTMLQLASAPAVRDCNMIVPTPQKTPLSFENFMHGSEYQGLFANSEHQFAMCMIEKNACSSWNKVLAPLVGAIGPYWNVPDHFTADTAESVFRNPKSIRAVFVRDPLERFLSGFLDKCVGSCDNTYCLPRIPYLAGKQMENHPGTVSLMEFIDWMEQEPEQLHLLLDGHFRPQSSHCELDKRLNEYNAIGIMTAPTLGRDAICLLQKAGLQSLNEYADSSIFDDFSANETAMNQEAQTLLKQYYTPEAAQKVMKLYEADYRLFEFQQPSWLQAATGERLQTQTCEDPSGLLQILDR